MRRATPLVLLVLLIGACAPGTGASTTTTSSSATPSPTPSVVEQAEEEQSFATRTVARLTNINSNFYEQLGTWLDETGGKPRGKKFRSLELLGLKKQKLMRRLIKREKLADEVLPELPSGLRLEAKRNIKAARGLYRLTTPLKPPVKMKTSIPEGPQKLLRLYDEGQRRFRVPWSILAAVNLVESKMGRLNGPSSAGALGPMQFMPATWDAYGKGSPFNTHNAIVAAARYLAANGAPGDLHNALWHYNHSDHYVNGVLAYHRQLKAKPESYYSYYFWHVFVRTTKGDKQLTGPGSNYPH